MYDIHEVAKQFFSYIQKNPFVDSDALYRDFGYKFGSKIIFKDLISRVLPHTKTQKFISYTKENFGRAYSLCSIINGRESKYFIYPVPSVGWRKTTQGDKLTEEAISIIKAYPNASKWERVCRFVDKTGVAHVVADRALAQIEEELRSY